MPLSTAPSEIYTDTTPDSSPDPYATSTTPTSLPSHIDIGALPHGLPIFGPLTGYSPTNLTRLIHSRYAALSQSLSRSLTEDEMSAIAYHTSKGHAIASFGPTIGLAGGAYRTWATWKEMRWPFYGALLSEEVGKGFWDGTSMRIAGREILTGWSAEAKASLVHGFRGSAYASLGVVIVPLVVSAYGATVSAVGEIRDNRLQDVTRELRRVANKDLRGRRQGAVERSTGQGRKSAGDVWRERREKIGGAGVDDASPTGGAMDYGHDEEQGRFSGAGDMGGELSDGQMRTEERRAQPEPSAGRGSPENRASTFQMEKVERQPRSFADDYDDASPTGGSGTGSGEEGGSVWERIRNQTATGGASASSGSRGRRSGIRQEQQEGSTTGDSFSFSSSEEERSYAKDEAQREFDERVEKERRGGDFNSGSGKRW